MFISAINSNIHPYGDRRASGGSLKWPFKELQFVSASLFGAWKLQVKVKVADKMAAAPPSGQLQVLVQSNSGI